ncbi:MAG: hypothetical protein MJK04_36645 [Psychrosphaera sp.]|nr:hypothetical protein [Psychrosphaera sp.]
MNGSFSSTLSSTLFSTVSAIGLLLRAYKGLWLALLSILITMILLFSYLMLMKKEMITDERSQLGLMSTAQLSSTESNLSLGAAHDIAQQINAEYGALVVPVNIHQGLKCRFFTRTSYIKEVKEMVDGFEEWIDKKVNVWVANGEFTVELNQIDLSVSRPLFTLQRADSALLGHFEVLEFAEDATRLGLSNAIRAQLDDKSHYYFSYDKVEGMLLGPLLYDKSSDFFMVLAEEDLDEANLPLLAKSEETKAAFVNAIYHHHLPFSPGAAIDQIQLDEYEYSFEEQQYNNKLMLNALLFDRPLVRGGKVHDEQHWLDNPSRALFTEALFTKVFPNPFDYKTLKFSCTDTTATVTAKSMTRIASVYGHYKLKPQAGVNPNQVFVAYQGKSFEAARVNRFLIKDLGGMDKAVDALGTELNQHDSTINWQLVYLNQQLKSYSLFIFIIIATAASMTAILLVLTLPLRKIMVQELFLIKLYGGRYHLTVMLCSLLLFVVAVFLAWGLGAVIMQYVNQSILAPYNVPFMRFDAGFFIWGCLHVLAIWLLIWGWVGAGLAKIVNQYGITSGG